jgi:hypothetical protein
MNRVYLLLRDNVQSGPYTFDELLQQQVQPSDLIWIEGKTLAWAYPYEIEDLKNSLSGNPVEPIVMPAVIPSSSKIPRPAIKKTASQEKKDINQLPLTAPKKPKDEIEKRAEELRKKALTFSSQHDYRHEPVLHPIHDFQPHLHDSDAVHFVHHKQNKGAPVGEILVGAMMIGLVVLGWYGGANKYFINRKPPIVNSVATQLVASDMHAAAKPAAAAAGMKDSITRNDTVSIQNFAKSAVPEGNIKNIAKKPVSPQLNDTTAVAVKSSNIQNTNVDSEEKKPEKIFVADKKQTENTETKQVERKQPEVIKPAELKKEETQKQQAAPEEDKKKTLGDVFKGLFKKKKH